MFKRLAVLAAIVFGLAAGGAAAQTVAGDWSGTIAPTPAQTLALVVHIKPAAGGGYSGTIDSPDQGASGLPLGGVTASGETLSFTLKIQPPGTFTGTWDAKAGAWAGVWKQGGLSTPLTLHPGLPAPKPVVAGLDGDWDGAVATPTGVKLHLTLHVRTGAGGTTAKLDSPDQLAYGLTVNDLSRQGDKVGFAMNALGAAYSGTLSADGKTMTGQWSQSDRAVPVDFTWRAPGAAGAALKRPQTPTKPYPYREEDVAFSDAADGGVKLAGTLTLPQGHGPFPAVVLVAGSGPNTRDEPILGHRPFLVLADHLTRHGIAVLRYDKRGTGASAGDYAAATTLDFAADAQAAAAYLRTRSEIDPKRVGLIGHSEGGLIAPMVAARDPATAFIVMMAGPGVDGADILLEQGRLIAKAMGMTDAQVADANALRRQIFDVVRTDKDAAAAGAKLKTLVAAYAVSHKLPPSGIEAQVDLVNSDWFRFFFNYDPAPTLAKVRCPVLALNGSKDLQVPPDQNLPPIRGALAGNPRAEVIELPGLNHLFQTATTGAPGEYARIEETIAPAALDLITNWILKETR